MSAVSSVFISLSLSLSLRGQLAVAVGAPAENSGRQPMAERAFIGKLAGTGRLKDGPGAGWAAAGPCRCAAGE